MGRQFGNSCFGDKCWKSSYVGICKTFCKQAKIARLTNMTNLLNLFAGRLHPAYGPALTGEEGLDRRAPQRRTFSSLRGPPPQRDGFDDGEQVVHDNAEQSDHDQQRIDLGLLEIPLGLDHQRTDAGQ